MCQQIHILHIFTQNLTKLITKSIQKQFDKNDILMVCWTSKIFINYNKKVDKTFKRCGGVKERNETSVCMHRVKQQVVNPCHH